MVAHHLCRHDDDRRWLEGAGRGKARGHVQARARLSGTGGAEEEMASGDARDSPWGVLGLRTGLDPGRGDPVVVGSVACAWGEGPGRALRDGSSGAVRRGGRGSRGGRGDRGDHGGREDHDDPESHEGRVVRGGHEHSLLPALLLQTSHKGRMGLCPVET